MSPPSVVSVVIPVYNGAAHLAECLASACAQSLAAIEVLVVDDGSADASAEIAAGFAQRDPRVRLLRHEGGQNRGVSRSRRLAVDEARGEFIAFLDADDRFAPDKLSRQVAALEREGECVLCHTAVQAFSDDESTDAPVFESHFEQLGPAAKRYGYLDRADALKQNPVCTSSVLVRTAAVRRRPFGLPQLFQYEDFLLWTLLAADGPFLYLPEKLTQYRVHEKSATARVKRDQLVRCYSHVEFLLSVVALAGDDRPRALAEAELGDTLCDIVNIYASESLRLAGEAAAADPLAAAEIAGALRQRADAKRLADLQRENARLKARNADYREALARFENHALLGPMLRLRRRWFGRRQTAPKSPDGET